MREPGIILAGIVVNYSEEVRPMGLIDSLRRITGSINTEYDRRIKSASLVKSYDPTGASHHHDHVEVHNEHIEGVESDHTDDGYTVFAEPTPAEENLPPRAVRPH